jgi:hypothetical protein
VKRLSLLLLLGCGQPTEPQPVMHKSAEVAALNISADTLSVSVIKIGKVTLQATLGTRGPGSRLMLQSWSWCHRLTIQGLALRVS